jgi:hypothetical protein
VAGRQNKMKVADLVQREVADAAPEPAFKIDPTGFLVGHWGSPLRLLTLRSCGIGSAG